MRREASKVKVTVAGALHPGRPQSRRMREWYVSATRCGEEVPEARGACATIPSDETAPVPTRASVVTAANEPRRVVFNHLGQVVTDLERSRAFYEQLLGFEFWRQIEPPDASSARLLGLSPPLGMIACYLRRDGLVLELLHFRAERHRRAPARRSMSEPGLTHLSLSCDVADVCSRIAEFGGEVLTDTDIGAAVFVRDPDGQLVELLPLAYADQFAE